MVKHIYALKLENDKYFVGATANLSKTYSQHVNEARFEWTVENPVIGFLFVCAEKESSDEITYTRLLMKKYGVENVRGGLISNVILTDKQMESITKHLDHLSVDSSLEEATEIRNNLLKKVKIELPNNHGKKWTDEEKQDVRRLATDGAPHDFIAMKHGRSVNAILRLLD